MRETYLAPGQERLLKRVKAVGIDVDFVFLETQDEMQITAEKVHHQAVVLAMDLVRARVDAWAEKTASEESIPRSKIFQVQVDPRKQEVMKGRRIDEREFLGSRYHHVRNGLIVRGESPLQNEFFFHQDRFEPKNILGRGTIDNGIGTGYAYAFSDPPYGIRLRSKEIAALFTKVNNYLLGGISKQSIIFKWPTDWSNYFDAGHEWWGSFLWSFANPGDSRIIVILASSTD